MKQHPKTPITTGSELLSHQMRRLYKPLQHMMHHFLITALFWMGWHLYDRLQWRGVLWLLEIPWGWLHYGMRQLGSLVMQTPVSGFKPLFLSHGGWVSFEQLLRLQGWLQNCCHGVYGTEWRWAVFYGLLAAFGTALGYYLNGLRAMRETIVEGIPLAGYWKRSVHQLLLDTQSSIQLGSILLPKAWFTQHTLLMGQGGSGKTTALIQLLDQLRARGDRVVLVDKGYVLILRYFKGKGR